MRLVEDDGVVVGEHGASTGQVSAVEVGVHDDDVGQRGSLPGRLGEAPVTGGAVEATGTRVADAHHVPGPVARLEGEITPVAGFRRLRPGQEGAHLVDDALGRRCARAAVAGPGPGPGLDPSVPGPAPVRGPLGGIAQLGLDPSRPHLGHALEADVVAAPLEDGEVQRDPQAGGHLG